MEKQIKNLALKTDYNNNIKIVLKQIGQKKYQKQNYFVLENTINGEIYVYEDMESYLHDYQLFLSENLEN